MNRELAQEQILRDVLRLLRRQGAVIIGTALLALGVAVGYSLLKTPVYEATAELQFIDQTEYLPELGLGVGFTNIDPAKRAAQDAERVTSPEVLEAVQGSVDSDLSASELKDSVETAVNPDNNLVALSVQADSAKLSSDIANAFAEETRRVLTATERRRLSRTARNLEDSVSDEEAGSIARVNTEQTAAQLRSLAEAVRPVETASLADEPSGPVSPQPVRDSILALILGLLFGTLLAFLRDSLDRRLKDPHDIQHQLRIPMLGYVDAAALGGVGYTRNGSNAGSEGGLEPFRILRSNVEFLAPDQSLRTLAITSPVAEEGKSTVAAGLATASVLAGKRVLLVESDLRRPVLAERFGIAGAPGLTDWGLGDARPAEVLQEVSIDGAQGDGEGKDAGASSPSLIVITAGSYSDEPAELLASQRFAGFVDQVSRVYDLVIFDCAPLLPVGDTLEVMPRVDGALLCIRLDQTTREQALAAKAAVEHLPERPVGLVLTGVRPGREGYYYGYYSSHPSSPAVVISPGVEQSTGISQK